MSKSSFYICIIVLAVIFLSLAYGPKCNAMNTQLNEIVIVCNPQTGECGPIVVMPPIGGDNNDFPHF